MGHELRTGFAVRIRIVAVKRICLSVSPFPFIVLIDFIGRYIQEGTHRFHSPDRLKNMYGSHNIGLIGIDRIPV